MSTVLTPVGNAIYKRIFESSSSSVLVSYDRQAQNVSLPYTIITTPRNSSDLSPYTLFAFEYNIPEELKYKKINIKVSFNSTKTAQSGSHPNTYCFISSSWDSSFIST